MRGKGVLFILVSFLLLFFWEWFPMIFPLKPLFCCIEGKNAFLDSGNCFPKFPNWTKNVLDCLINFFDLEKFAWDRKTFRDFLIIVYDLKNFPQIENVLDCLINVYDMENFSWDRKCFGFPHKCFWSRGFSLDEPFL